MPESVLKQFQGPSDDSDVAKYLSAAFWSGVIGLCSGAWSDGLGSSYFWIKLVILLAVQFAMWRSKIGLATTCGVFLVIGLTGQLQAAYWQSDLAKTPSRGVTLAEVAKHEVYGLSYKNPDKFPRRVFLAFRKCDPQIQERLSLKTRTYRLAPTIEQSRSVAFISAMEYQSGSSQLYRKQTGEKVFGPTAIYTRYVTICFVEIANPKNQHVTTISHTDEKGVFLDGQPIPNSDHLNTVEELLDHILVEKIQR